MLISIVIIHNHYTFNSNVTCRNGIPGSESLWGPKLIRQPLLFIWSGKFDSKAVKLDLILTT